MIMYLQSKRESHPGRGGFLLKVRILHIIVLVMTNGFYLGKRCAVAGI